MAGSSTARASLRTPAEDGSSPAGAFYFDLASPLAYLTAERVLHELPGAAEWQPVQASEIPGAQASEIPGAQASEIPGAQDAPHRAGAAHELSRAEIARRALELGLQPLRWPEPFPFDSSLAMLVATYAKSIGRAVPFAQAAFRQAFAGGHSLQEPDFVLIAAAACEMHPTAVLRAAAMRSVAEQLKATTTAAVALGVREVPALAVGGRIFQGERALEQAAAHMRDERSAGRSR